MGLFSRPVELDNRLASAIIGSEPSDRKQMAKIQNALLSALTTGETLVWISATVLDTGVMALTDQRIIYGSGREIGYVIPGDRVARTSIGAKTFYGRRHHCIHVNWFGGPLNHQSIRNFELSNDFLGIWRYEYDEVNRMCSLIDRQFGLT